MSDEVLLSTEHLYATHPGRPMVLTDVNVTFRAGVRVAILGANGSGKTTLMRCLSGSLKPVKGKVKRGGTGRFSSSSRTPTTNSSALT